MAATRTWMFIVPFLVSTAQSQNTVWFSNTEDPVQIGSSCLVLEDSGNHLRFSDLVSPDIFRQFRPTGHDIPNFGFTSSTIWILGRIGNRGDNASHLVLEVGYPLIDFLRVYVQNSDGSVLIQEGGTSILQGPGLKNRNPVFRLSVAPRDSVTILLQVLSSGAMVVPLTLHHEDRFLQKINDENLILGMYYGILLVLLTYNLILFFSFRDVVYLCYTVLVFCFGLSQFTFDGFLHLYLPGVHPWVGQHIFPFAFAVNIVVAQVLTQRLLATNANAPSYDKVMNLMKAAGILAMLVIPVLPLRFLYPTVSVLTIIAVLVLLPPGILRWRQGYQPAKPFTVAIAALSVAVLVRMFRNLGILSDISLGVHPVHFGTLLDALLLSVSLSDRVNLRKIENELGKVELRDRLARDLHDDLASTLGSISLFATSLSSKLKRAPREVRELIDRIGAMASDSVDTISDIVWSVSPERDTMSQLLTRMQDFASQLCTAHGIQYELIMSPGPVELWLNPEVRRNLYLVFKEAIHNAVRHSGARKITVEAGITGATFKLQVRDNGRGFRTARRPGRGHGVRSMEKRALSIGANFKLETSPGSGTSVVLSKKMT
jgi:signal transduction histidine kinase